MNAIAVMNVIPSEPSNAQKIARMHRDALYVQSACNLGAIVRTFARIMETLQKQARDEGHGTEWINRHPVCVLFAEQIHHLTGSSQHYAHSYVQCDQKQYLFSDIRPLLLESRTVDTSGGNAAIRMDSTDRSRFALITKLDNSIVPDADDTEVTVGIYRSTGSSEDTDYQNSPYEGANVPVHALLTYLGSHLT